MELLTEREQAFIASQPVCRVATLNTDGSIHVVPLCPVVLDGAVYVDLQHALRTEANLRREPRATVLFDEYSSDWRKLWGVQLRCAVELLQKNGEEWSAAWRRMEEHYPQYAVLAWEARQLVRLTPQAKVSWGT